MEENDQESDFDFICNLHKKGVDKMKDLDLKSAKGRLEYAVECHPEIDPDRLKVPAEIQDMTYYLSKSLYKDSLKEGAIWLTGGLIAEVVGCAGLYKSFQMANSNNYGDSLVPALVLSASILLAMPALTVIRGGIGFLIDGFRYRKEFNDSKWNRLLNTTERNLINYVYSSKK